MHTVNTLEAVILDQHRRVVAAGENPVEALAESQGEILEVATPELVAEIITDDRRGQIPREQHNLAALISAQNNEASIHNRHRKFITNAHRLGRLGKLVSEQGYTGGIIFDHDTPIVYGHSATYSGIKLDDPIQEAMGDTLYPPMMWAKALRAEAYRNRPESMLHLSVAEYLATLDLSLGSILTEHGDIVGATGFMPGPQLQEGWADKNIEAHIESEPIEAFRLSGLCDQVVLEPIILSDTRWFATSVLMAHGSLN